MGCTPSTLQQQQDQNQQNHDDPEDRDQEQTQVQDQTKDQQKAKLQHQHVDFVGDSGTNMKTRDPTSRLINTGGSSGSGSGSGSPRSWRFKKASDKEKTSSPRTSATRPMLPQRTNIDNRLDNIVRSPTASPIKVLLVFAKDDPQLTAIRGAAHQLGYECSLARSTESCVDAFTSRCHDLVIVDNRDPKNINGEHVGSALRNVKCSQYTVLVALVKRQQTEKEESTILAFLNAGYDRWMVETSNLPACVSELLQMETADVQPRKQLWAFHSFLLATDRARELCIITDSVHKVVYVNRAAERMFAMTSRDMVGRPVLELTRLENRERMLQNALKGREWEGMATCHTRRQVVEPIVLHCRVTPNGTSGRPPNNLVFMMEPPGASKRGSESGVSARGSVPSVRRGSADMRSVCSDGLRRQSVTKLNALSIEAPITQVIALISSAQESSTPEVCLILDKVVDILRTNELYSPIVREDKLRPGDPVTSDLISALLQHGSTGPLSTTRRSSNDSAVSRTPQQRVPRAPSTGAVSQLTQLLDTGLLWEFDIFKLEELSGRRPLVHLGMSLMTHFEVGHTLNCDDSTLQNWLTIIEVNYKPGNSYHNSTHAADVMQASATFLERERLQRIMEPMDSATCLIAAAAHDVDHPGKSSAFLCNSDHELAILYNDICVLESHHSALAFKLTMSDERVNIFKGLERDVYKQARQSVIDMILATEMTKHFEHLAKFVNVFSKTMPEDSSTNLELSSDAHDSSLVMTSENIALVKRMLIKCADVSNPARPLRMCVEWARRIAEEYFTQTEEEKRMNLPVVMPMFDRNTCSIPKSQIGFMDFIINDMFEAWEAFIEMPDLMINMEGNYRYWKDKEAQGVRLVAGETTSLQSEQLLEQTSPTADATCDTSNS